jgi:hypothetical protein
MTYRQALQELTDRRQASLRKNNRSTFVGVYFLLGGGWRRVIL